MLDDVARAQLAAVVDKLHADPKLTVSLGTLKAFVGGAAVEEIKTLKDDLAKQKKAFKKSGESALSDGAQEYVRRFRLLKMQAERCARNPTRAWEVAISRASERLNDDFHVLVPEREHEKFKIHKGWADEENWDWRWEGLEARPPLPPENKGEFPIVSPMNYAQLSVLGEFVAEPLTPEEEEAAEQRRQKRRELIAKNREAE